MKKIFSSLCIHFLLLLISDAVPLKLIPGDRSVVKKNGTTHTITKYYVVPNDLDLNNVTNNTEASLKSTIQVNKSKYSKRMNLEAINEDEATEDNAEAANNQSDEYSDTVINKSVDNVAESLESVNTQLSLEPEILGTLQVEPLTNSYNLNNSVINETNVNIIYEGFRKESTFVDNSTQNIENDLQDQLGDLLLTKFGITVHESAAQNLESFWKLLKKYNIDENISINNELLGRIEKLFLLLNIFTNLYEASQLQKPIESMIDDIVDILQKPYVKNLKSNRVESRFEQNVLGDQETERECLRKCGLFRSKPHVDSNGAYLSETDGRESSDNLELENGYLDSQRRDTGNLDDINLRANLHSSGPGLNQVTDSEQPITIQSRFLNHANNARHLKGVPDGYNVRSSIAIPNLKVVTRDENTLEDLLLNNNILASAETGENIKDLPWTIEDKTIDDLPWSIEDKSTEKLPWRIEDQTNDDIPWTIDDKPTTDNIPSIIENRATYNLPWTIKSNSNNNLPWTTVNKIGHLPITWYQSSGQSLATNGGEITLEPNPTPLANTVKKIRKPYNIYTYIINTPSKRLYLTPNTGNFFDVKSAQYNNNLGTKFVNPYKPSSSYYRSELSLSKEPSIKLGSHLSNSQWKNKNNVDLTIYNTREEQNSVDVLPENPQDNHQSKYINGLEKDTIFNPTILLSNENDVPKVQQQTISETISDSGVPLPNVPSASLEPLLNSNIVKDETVSTASAQSDVSIYPENVYTEPNYDSNIGGDLQASFISNNPTVQVAYEGQTDKRPGLISKAPYSEYTQSASDYNTPTLIYGGETDNHPLKIPEASAQADITIYPENVYTEPYDSNVRGDLQASFISNKPTLQVAYGGQTNNRPGLISKAPYSEYTQSASDYNTPTLIYGGETDNHPLKIPEASAQSDISIYPENVYTEPYDSNIRGHLQASYISDKPTVHVAYGGLTNKRPGLISKAPYSEYTQSVSDYNTPTLIYGGETDNHPLKIPEASAQSEISIYPENVYTEPNYYDSNIGGDLQASYISNKPTVQVAYGGLTNKRPGLIYKAPYSGYTQSVSDYNTPTLIYGGETDNHPLKIPEALSYYPKYKKFANSLVYRGETDNILKFLGLNQPYGHVKFCPSKIQCQNANRLNYLKHLKRKLAPTYQLFALDNLLKLQNAIAREMQINALKNHENRALTNLNKIISILLIMADNLGETEGSNSNEWYKNIFYNVQQRQHPLHAYAYNLIRQRWLHELMILLYKNNFNLNILHKPRICSLLGAWRFPNHVQRLLEIKGLPQGNFNRPNAFGQTINTQNVISNNIATQPHQTLEETPDYIKNYMAKNVLNNYKEPNEDIVVSIAGVEAEPDALTIIEILQKYLLKKSYIENQENVIIRDNKIEMLKQIQIFLREKGYRHNIIEDLIRKLYSVVYSTEGKRCPFASRKSMENIKNMYDVILPVLRSSKQ